MCRFCQVPTFCHDTICKFSWNASDTKQLAAQNFEGMLQVQYSGLALRYGIPVKPQCAIPMFEGLLDEPMNSLILNLLFILAEWHAYAKLRLHSKTTLSFLDTGTTHLGMYM